ncbi:MAG: flagellar basal body L-ring protein FlgH [Deltaproteobacteria bacterium]|uniref:flagellar basal body L-ring protein FlgH n=1 Tax=Hydrosulfovibrio ferrireducens TaxID=2934181 RepID=UPI0012236149|nr:MAG: flagellar basal body L-ring protein FlgH [Deltaproteobacteria bacterium]
MRTTLHTTSLILLLAGLSGCAAAGSQQAQQLPERYTLPAPAKAAQTRPEGTIYASANSLDLYADSRAKRIGDIVLVRIVETSKGNKEANTKTERESTVTGGVSSLFGLETWLADKNSRFSPSLTELQARLTNDFEGKGKTDRKSNVTATISARVIDITTDGNLNIRGYQEVKVNNETQHIILSGIIRPQDVAQDNSVLSTHVADARIEYSGQGVLGDKQQPGWLARALDSVWPF